MLRKTFTESQCLYKGALYFFTYRVYLRSFSYSDCLPGTQMLLTVFTKPCHSKERKKGKVKEARKELQKS